MVVRNYVVRIGSSVERRHNGVRRIIATPSDDPRKSPTAEALYRDLQELEKVWVDVQSSRSRDAIYLYLARVYKIVFAWQRRQCVKKLVARTQAWAGHRVDRRAEPYAVVIAATTEAKELDGKTISKWSRALRFIRRYKQRRISLKVFARRHGGINGCAAEFAARSGRQTATH